MPAYIQKTKLKLTAVAVRSYTRPRSLSRDQVGARWPNKQQSNRLSPKEELCCQLATD